MFTLLENLVSCVPYQIIHFSWFVQIGLYKLVSTNVNLKEAVLYGRGSVELSRNPNERGMVMATKKVGLRKFLD